MNIFKNNFRQNIKKPAYVGINAEDDGLYVAIKIGDEISAEYIKTDKKDIDKKIFAWLYNYSLFNDVKIISACIVSDEKKRKLTTDIWLKEDIVPCLLNIKEGNGAEKAKKAAIRAADKFKNNNLADIKFDIKRKVIVERLARLEDFKKTISKEKFNLLLELVKKFKEQKGKLIFFSSTPRGGGVALMRHALIRIYHLLGVDASWYVMSPNQKIFNITKKKFHNTLQNISNEESLTEKDKELFNQWSKKNAERFSDVFKQAKVIVIDDPQPSGLVPYIKKENPEVKIIYRSHIQIEGELAERKGTPQNKTWSFIWNNIKDIDLFVSHPVKKFIPPNVPKKKTVLIGAVTDYLDGLNKKLTKRHMQYYFDLFNGILLENEQTSLNIKRPYIIQVARFDPSKGIPDVIKSYGKLREKIEKEKWAINKIPQLVIVGHEAIDDPEGELIYQTTMGMLKMDNYAKCADDIKVARLPHSDQILNALLRGSFICLQLSHKEGFEIKVSEAISKGRHVIAYKIGGLPLQIEDKISGYLVNVGDTDKVAEILYQLLINKNKYLKFKSSARRKIKSDFFTVGNALKWLFLATELIEKGKLEGNCRLVEKIIKKEK